MLVNNFLEESTKKYSEKIALIVSEGRFTYREVDEMANKVSQALLAEGLEKGDRAVIFMDNSVDAVVSLFGVLKAGGVFVMVNPTTKAEKLTYLLNNCRASALISSLGKLPVIKEACKGATSLRRIYLGGDKIAYQEALPKKTLSLMELFSCNHGHPPSSSIIDMDLASIIYTSGSTGHPKGVMMSHLNMVSAANSITQYLENSSDDIILNVLPLSFDYGLYQVLMGFKMGATVILERTFLYPYRVIDIMMKEKVTGFPIVPVISAILLQMEDIKRHNFDHLRYITNTAAALPVSHIQKLRAVFPKARIYSMYGLTECKRVSYLPPDQIDIRPNSVGKAMPNVEIHIVDETGNPVGPGVIGELIVNGPNVMKGYWEMPEETAKRLRPFLKPVHQLTTSPPSEKESKGGFDQGFSGETALYTGDLFKMDEDGYLYFAARKDDIIKSRGEKVSPREIENILYEIDGIVEAAVIGVPDPVLGEAIKALIVLKDGVNLSEKDILRYCSQHVEDFMVPTHVEFRKELPKTSTGKVKKTELK